MYIFQLTSSQGGWRYLVLQTWTVPSFNSHPHKEDDCQVSFSVCQHSLSTHILTRRMTSTHFFTFDCKPLSTHILTRRMTVYRSSYQCARRDFQLTSSQGGWPDRRSEIVASKSFQLTSSQGGWHGNKGSTSSRCLSTHILTRRMTRQPLRLLPLFAFQLTSSQGGWHGRKW